MATLTITLADDRIAFLREQAESRGSSIDAYIDGLVTREAKTREAKDRLRALLIEGLESGPAEEVTPETWKEIEREVYEQLEAERRRS
jgi:antitoxin ParD1/3/4